MYSKYVERGMANEYWEKEIRKDIHRTFPSHPYFDERGP
jgi:hypothetical protein